MLVHFLLTLVLIPLVDLPWLWLSSKVALPAYEKIQGGRRLDPWLLAALPVYLALAYLHTQRLPWVRLPPVPQSMLSTISLF